MNKISKFKIELSFALPLLLFMIMSILTIYSTGNIFSFSNSLVIKQISFYFIGILTIFGVMKLGNKFIFRHIFILYLINIGLLIFLLFFGEPVNNARCWINLGPISLQPSEFMKVILIIIMAKYLSQVNDNKAFDYSVKDELLIVLKILAIIILPAILTFLQPDTGVVIMYLVIMITVLFVFGLRYRWFVIVFGIVTILLSSFLLLYFFASDTFINLFGNSMFLRLDRLLDWSSGQGYQLERSLIAIGSSGIFGNGLQNIPVYFPESTTDFIFASYASTFGFVGSSLLIILFTYFNIRLMFIAFNTDKTINKLIIAGTLGMLIYQQIQNIGMTMGLLPITGITLPFLSYGGSSLISYMFILGIIFNISNDSNRYTN